jgi:alpha-galactosidase
MVASWEYALTPVSYRREHLQERLKQCERLFKGEEAFELKETGEEGVQQIRALLGLNDMVTNVNIPNVGQIPNLPLGAVVETNACFAAGTLKPVYAGPVPASIYPLVSRIAGMQELLVEATFERDMEKVFRAFLIDPLMNLTFGEARQLFNEMIENTQAYLKMYAGKIYYM